MSKRPRPAPPAAERQDYLASVSDLMSSLIFIFINTRAVFSLKLAKAQQSLNDTTKRLKSADSVRSDLLGKLEQQLLSSGVDVEVDYVQGVLRLTDNAIGFERGRAEPQPPENVGVLAAALMKVLPVYVVSCRPPEEDPAAAPPRAPFCSPTITLVGASNCGTAGHTDPRVETVLVEGHTDSVPIRQPAKYKDNLELSSARSSEVLRMMTEICEPGLKGLLNRSGAPVVSVSGYGDTRPVDAQDRQADVNRRIDLRFLMELPLKDDDSNREIEPIEATRQELAS